MRILLLRIIFLQCIFCSCKHDSNVELVYRDSFPKDTVVELTRISMDPAQIRPQRMLMNKGKILIYTSTMDDTVYSVFRYPEMSFVSYFGRQSEYVVPLDQLNTDLFLVRGDSLFSYQWTTGDTLRRISVSYFHKGIPSRMLGVVKLDDKTYAYPNKNDFSGLSDYFLVDISKHEVYPVGAYPISPAGFYSISDFKAAYCNTLLPKPDGSRLLLFYHKTRRCRIYDRGGYLLHDILLNYDPCQNVVDIDVHKLFIHINCGFSTDKYIYLLCPDDKKVGGRTSLLVLNWDGEFLVRYRMDQWISYFFIDESNNKFCGVNSSDYQSFYFFDLI